jgi:hypothetical protein
LPSLELSPGADSWAHQFKLSIERELTSLQWARARQYAAAELPDATQATNYLARVTDTGNLAVSDGTAWLTVPTMLSGSATFDPASLADGDGATTTVTVTGAALGDFALASFSVALAGITVTAWVSATDTVSVRLQNESGGVLDLASGTLRARVIKK